MLSNLTKNIRISSANSETVKKYVLTQDSWMLPNGQCGSIANKNRSDDRGQPCRVPLFRLNGWDTTLFVKISAVVCVYRSFSHLRYFFAHSKSCKDPHQIFPFNPVEGLFGIQRQDCIVFGITPFI